MATASDIWTKWGIVLTTIALFFGIFISNLVLEWKAISVLFVWLAAITFYFDHKIKIIEHPKAEVQPMEDMKNKIDKIYDLLKSKKATIDPVVLALAVIAFIFLVLIFLQGK